MAAGEICKPISQALLGTGGDVSLVVLFSHHAVFNEKRISKAFASSIAVPFLATPTRMDISPPHIPTEIRTCPRRGEKGRETEKRQRGKNKYSMRLLSPRQHRPGRFNRLPGQQQLPIVGTQQVKTIPSGQNCLTCTLEGRVRKIAQRTLVTPFPNAHTQTTFLTEEASARGTRL